jgi:hypothetical protein
MSCLNCRSGFTERGVQRVIGLRPPACRRVATRPGGLASIHTLETPACDVAHCVYPSAGGGHKPLQLLVYPSNKGVPPET